MTPEAHGGDVSVHAVRAPGLFGDLPALTRLITTAGISGLIALFLVYRGASSLPQIQQDIVLARVLQERTNTEIVEVIQNQQRIIRLLQRICATIAKTDEDRGRCFDN